MAKKKREFAFQHVRTTGPMLPSDVLQRGANEDPKLPGLKATDYGLAESERLGEAITRSWTRLLDIHKNFSDEMAVADPTDTAATPTFKAWLKYLFQELGYGSLTATPQSRMVDETAYPISHQWKQIPIHLVGANVPLDRRTSGVTGASKSAPHSLAQEFINRSDEALWAIVSNGRQLRLLRDNVSMTRQAFVEFDLDGMFKGQSFADFRLLWLVLHASRFDVAADGQPHQCIIEQWHVEGTTVGTRVLGELSKGVRQAIEALGRGFLARPANAKLREALASGELGKQEYYRQLLRLVYRFVFLFVAESRDLLLDPKASKTEKDAYRRYYSATRLQELAGKLRGNRHPDLYESLKLVMTGLGGPEGLPQIGITPLGGYLWSPAAIGLLGESSLSNHALLAAVRALSYIVDKDGRRTVDYRNLGSEELGGVYEQLLELHPEINPTAPSADKRFTLEVSAGNERKTSGSHYTPDSLVQVCLNTALEPLLAERLAGKKGSEAEKTILALKVVDTAVGSGHFLIGAAHRIAKRLAAVRTGDTEPSPEAYRTALRDVIRSCLYGVDLNPMAAELCRVALWLESMEPGKPLSFLDHHVKVGNSLLGATPALMAKGIPDEAFEAIEGDDKKLCTQYRKANKRERQDAQNKQMGLFAQPIKLGNLPIAYATMAALPDDSLAAVEEKRRQYGDLVKSADYLSGRLLADAWCAAFVWKKTGEFDYPVTEEVFRALEANPRSQPAWMIEEIQRLARQYRFFHWHLEFPDVFRVPAEDDKAENELMGWSGGFDCVLGNPVWERVKLQEQEFFAERAPVVANAPNATARKKLIAGLMLANPPLWGEWCDALREAQGTSHFLRKSGRYPLCGVGDINTYAVFAEHNRCALRSSGRAAFIVPSGIVTDDTTKAFFENLVSLKDLAAVYHFENEEKLFAGVEHLVRFVVLGIGREDAADLFFFARQATHLADVSRHFTLTSVDFAALNPNTRTCPTFRSVADAELNKLIYRRIGVLWDERLEDGNRWQLTFLRMFDMANDSGLFRTRGEMEEGGQTLSGNHWDGPLGHYLPLVEAKMVNHFDHRFATYSGATQAQLNVGMLPRLSASDHEDPCRQSSPSNWVAASGVGQRMGTRRTRRWLLGVRDICRSTDIRTVISALVPLLGVGNKLPLLLSQHEPTLCACLYASLCSIPLDYCARQKVGGTTLNYFLLKQFPVPPPNVFGTPCEWAALRTISGWLVPLVVELTYTAWDIEAFGIDCGYEGPPYRWNEDRRFVLRAELDSAFFHLYLGTPDEWERDASTALKAKLPTPRHAVEHIMETFPIVKKKDVEAHGTYRTKDTILSIYDEMAEAIRTGDPYQTRLDPPPADDSCRHPESTRPSWAKPVAARGNSSA
jgi:hypothetical protein